MTTIPANPSRPTLDEAWAEAEAALPEGWTLSLARFSGDPERRYRAHAVDYRGLLRRSSADTTTPAAALQALAARLREQVR